MIIRIYLVIAEKYEFFGSILTNIRTENVGKRALFIFVDSAWQRGRPV
jgi:hypothetical protein